MKENKLVSQQKMTSKVFKAWYGNCVIYHSWLFFASRPEVRLLYLICVSNSSLWSFSDVWWNATFKDRFFSSDVNFPLGVAKERSNFYCNSNCNHNDVLQAYVWNNNVYIKASPTAEAVQITKNGEENKIFNGIADWVYEGNCIKHILFCIMILKFLFVVNILLLLLSHFLSFKSSK